MLVLVEFSCEAMNLLRKNSWVCWCGGGTAEFSISGYLGNWLEVSASVKLTSLEISVLLSLFLLAISSFWTSDNGL